MGHRNVEDENGRVSELPELIARLTDEVNTLRIAVDELREELVYELRQLREGTPEWKARFRLTSMPTDPTLADFHQRVNSVDASVFAAPATTLVELMQRLTQEAATSQLAADDWIEDQEFPRGEVVEIDSAILDWFNEYLVVVKREGDWFLADDGEGWFFLLWSRDEKCYLRLLTNEQQQEITRLTGLQPATEYAEEGGPMYQPPTASLPPLSEQSTQRSLW